MAWTTSPEIKCAGFLGHARVEDNLQQEVAEFVAQIVQVVAFDRVRDLVGLFDRVGFDRHEVLFHVPRTTGFRIAQRSHDFDQARNVF